MKNTKKQYDNIVNMLFPFDKPDEVKRGIESMWNIQYNRVMMALAMTRSDKLMAVNMSFPSHAV